MIAAMLVMAAAGSLQEATDARRESSIEWRVTNGDTMVGYFKGVDGLSSELTVIDTVLDDNAVVWEDMYMKRPGRVAYGNVQLQHGYTNAAVFEWYNEAVAAGKSGNLKDNSYKKNLALTQLSFGVPIRTWKLVGCWPKQWKVNGFDGKSNDVVTEEITFVVEDMQMA